MEGVEEVSSGLVTVVGEFDIVEVFDITRSSLMSFVKFLKNTLLQSQFLSLYTFHLDF